MAAAQRDETPARHSAAQWLWCAWPGLRQLWFGGSVPALALAVAFGASLNVLLVGQLVWTEWFAPLVRLIGWTSVLVVWVVAAGVSWLAGRRAATYGATGFDFATGEPDPLAAAIDEYLQGKWYEAEKILRKLLRRNRRDAEASLMLATLCRRTGRTDEATRRLEELSALEAAAPWQREIEHERHLLCLRNNRDNSEETASTNTTSNDSDSSHSDTSHSVISSSNFSRNEAPPGTPDMTRAA
ncbi:MAG: tetratricopeptide repeat protein [Planctomycetia bacterium]|nr:tetratricopeptide repeat protein [Planctomycetia bacterium]